MSKTGWIWTVVAVMIVVAGIIWLMSQPAAMKPVADTEAHPSAMTGPSGDQTAPAPVVAPEPAPNTVPAGTVTGSADVAVTTSPMTATVTYNGKSFSPSTVTIAKGGKVTFVDSSGRGMWVASAMHPAHAGYDGITRDEHCAPGFKGAAPFDQCTVSSSYSFTFTKSGTWGYHDHVNASAFGKVVVQ